MTSCLFQSAPPRAGGDLICRLAPMYDERFQSAPPARGATARAGDRDHVRQSFNPRPPRGGRPSASGRRLRRTGFNPRPPRGGRRLDDLTGAADPEFQSAPPARGATGGCAGSRVLHRGFNPRPPRGGRLAEERQTVQVSIVSIRAPRAGGDLRRRVHRLGDRLVSIRAPRAGGDICFVFITHPPRGFNPRPPRGGRRDAGPAVGPRALFQSAPPARGATFFVT